MAELTSKFTREDLETLIEATGDWEMLGNREYQMLEMIRGAPMPPEDHEAYEIMSQIKEHYKKREREINASRQVRQERAVFLKAKLMLVRMELGTSQLFDMAASVDASQNPAKPAEKATTAASSEADEALKLAEFFIKDMGAGVWDYYQKFLQERKGGG